MPTRVEFERHHFIGPWYEVDVVGKVIEDGYITWYLDPTTYKITNRLHPGYWWSSIKAIISMTKEALTERKTNS